MQDFKFTLSGPVTAVAFSFLHIYTYRYLYLSLSSRLADKMWWLLA